MSRRILFKGKTEEGEWIFGFYHNETSKESPASDRKVTRHHIYTQDLDKFVIPETVGQFIGLTDKHGKKIFEGDIVKGCWKTIFEVYYDDCYLQYRAKAKGEPAREIDYYGNSSKLEVIGNKWDNPELL